MTRSYTSSEVILVGKLGTKMLWMDVSNIGVLNNANTYQINQESVAHSVYQNNVNSRYVVSGKTLNGDDTDIFVM